MNVQRQTDLVKEITEIAKLMPLERTIKLYQFALVLKTQSPLYEETPQEINRDEEKWKAQFAATSDDKLAILAASVEAEINNGKTLPMFDQNGEFIECR